MIGRRAFLLAAIATREATAAQPDVATIVQRSVAANERDWEAAPQYDYFERDRLEHGTKTYRVHMILGSQYNELTAVNGKPLPAGQQADEKRKLAETIAKRRAESPDEKSKRVADYRRGRERDHVMIQQLTKAFDFQFAGRQRLGQREVYVLKATPRADYAPPNTHAKVLTGMQGTLWIDTGTFQWARVVAEVIHPVSIAGFLAQVEPGTRFELLYSPVEGDIWFPNRYLMRSRAKILMLFTRRDHADETYYGFQKSSNSERF